MTRWLSKEARHFLSTGFWDVSYDKDQDIFIVFSQSGFTPTHEELREIIQELCKTYDVLSEEEIDQHNKEVYLRCFGDDINSSPKAKSKPKPTKTRNPAKGFLYLIRYADSNQFKIGLSANPSKRLEQLQTSTPNILHLVHTIKVDDMVGSELFFHLKYQSKRIRGEWFELSEDEVKEFCNYKEGDL